MEADHLGRGRDFGFSLRWHRRKEGSERGGGGACSDPGVHRVSLAACGDQTIGGGRSRGSIDEAGQDQSGSSGGGRKGKVQLPSSAHGGWKWL